MTRGHPDKGRLLVHGTRDRIRDVPCIGVTTEWAAASLIVGLPVSAAALISSTLLHLAGLRVGIVLVIAIETVCLVIACLAKSVRTIPTPDSW